MRNTKLILVNLLFLLFATYSCQVEEFSPIPTEINSVESSKKINPAFLTHKLSNPKMKLIWKSAITFENVDAVEVNFTLDKKYYKPLSKNDKVSGRQRLLLTFDKKESIKETILEYRPSDNFTGDIKEINSSNFKNNFEGEISFKNPLDDHAIIWVITGGSITKKLTEKKQKNNKTNKLAGYESCQWSTVNYWLCVGSGTEESCFYTDENLYQCTWIEDSPNPDPYDCSTQNWPWCSEGGGGSGGGENPPSATIEDKINGTNLDPCTNDVLNNLKNSTQNDIANMINHFNAGGSIFNINMSKGPVANQGNLAETTKAYGSNTDINMVFNENYINGNGNISRPTDLSVATTMAHEIIHAYLINLIVDYQACGNSGICDFPTVYEAFVQSKIDQNPNILVSEHHELIAKNYVDAIAAAIQEFNTGLPVTLGTASQVYTDLAWSGLFDTTIFNTKYPNNSNDSNFNVRQRIMNRYITEKNGSQYSTTSPVGTPCQK